MYAQIGLIVKITEIHLNCGFNREFNKNRKLKLRNGKDENN